MEQGPHSPSDHLAPVALTTRRYSDTPEVSTPARDRAEMQARINILETENARMAQTNDLVSQELDRVNGLLQQLTKREGGQKEYQFLVQQVDLMHRQLQSMNRQTDHEANLGQAQQQEQVESEMIGKLREEIKELTVSLKVWQGAFQQSEEKYRRKCEAERALKQTLRHREVRLSGMADKLAGYETWLQESNGICELLRSPTEPDSPERRRMLASDGASPISPISDMMRECMPGSLERSTYQPDDATRASQLSMPVLIWATFLAAYMLA
ncbi:hypothetical protein BGX31_003002 [Mortierella sp. GBA43]|nr:hypothetical protein BGX31_003002 [Mortierella sp. GBA43]